MTLQNFTSEQATKVGLRKRLNTDRAAHPIIELTLSSYGTVDGTVYVYEAIPDIFDSDDIAFQPSDAEKWSKKDGVLVFESPLPWGDTVSTAIAVNATPEDCDPFLNVPTVILVDETGTVQDQIEGVVPVSEIDLPTDRKASEDQPTPAKGDAEETMESAFEESASEIDKTVDEAPAPPETTESPTEPEPTDEPEAAPATFEEAGADDETADTGSPFKKRADDEPVDDEDGEAVKGDIDGKEPPSEAFDPDVVDEDEDEKSGSPFKKRDVAAETTGEEDESPFKQQSEDGDTTSENSPVSQREPDDETATDEGSPFKKRDDSEVSEPEDDSPFRQRDSEDEPTTSGEPAMDADYDQEADADSSPFHVRETAVEGDEVKEEEEEKKEDTVEKEEEEEEVEKAKEGDAGEEIDTTSESEEAGEGKPEEHACPVEGCDFTGTRESVRSHIIGKKPHDEDHAAVDLPDK